MVSPYVKYIINRINAGIKNDEKNIRSRFAARHSLHESCMRDQRRIVRQWIKDLREAKEALDGIKKQMPMPVKTHKGCAKCVCSGNGRAYLYNYHNYYCQNCNGLILHDMPDYPKYCPHCGQKLWW